MPRQRTARASLSIKRSVTADDLLRLRDIGQPDAASGFGPNSPLAVSRDGRQVAFLLSRADPATNGYCRGLALLSLDTRAVRLVDRGGEPILNEGPRGGVIVPIGYPVLITPVWSPNGRWIAYLRRDHGITQIRRVRVADGAADTVTRSPVDISAFAWTADGRLVFSSTPAQISAAEAIEREGWDGWHYDARVLPYLAARPRLSAALPLAFSVIDPDRGLVVPAQDTERALLGQAARSGAIASNGRRAWFAPGGPGLFSRTQLFATDRAGRTVRCDAKSCAGGFTGLWWNATGTELRYLRREGWHDGDMALYRWKPGSTPRRIVLTRDVLLGCVTGARGLICTREAATVPRTIVRLDPATGRATTLFDPNPEFGGIALGTVERLTWRNTLGFPAYGDLVLPSGYRPGTHLPMIVVQYHSQGFLRGGTGDEYPIQLFAAHGFAVLSVERADDFGMSVPGLVTPDQINAADARDWAELRSQVSSIETGVKLVLARGIADPARIGITGLSAGAMSAKFALLNTHMFAAASLSGSSIEPKTIMTYTGTAFADLWHSYGYPLATQDAPDYWRPFSWALGAGRLHAPILLQVPEDEYLLTLEAYTALRELGRPVDLYVYPGEHHEKWQSAHRRALYARNLDWFDFWLRGVTDPDPAKAAQYARWEGMRAATNAIIGADPQR